MEDWGKGDMEEIKENDCCGRKLTTVDPQERSASGSGARSAMHAASGSTFHLGDAPAPTHLSKI